MRVSPIKTERVTPGGRRLIELLDAHLPAVGERSVLAITSKVVALCEGRAIPVGEIEKAALVRREAERYLPPETSRYGITLTIKRNVLIPSAGIDESNAAGHYVLWPADPQRTANEVRAYLTRRFSLAEVGVVITDSKTTPLRWGVTGVGIAHSGFAALNNYVGRPDLFGKPLAVTRVNVMDGLAGAAVLVMGEGSEGTPLALIDDLPFVTFQPRDPTDDELRSLHIGLEEDLYAPLLTSVDWRLGGQERDGEAELIAANIDPDPHGLGGPTRG